MTTEPFFCEVAGRRLFAVLHRPDRSPARGGFVFCHPYGEEKQFSDRVLVRFARRLRSEGYGVLRFDCSGYGDSAGALEETSLALQVEETLALHRLARERLGLPRIGLLGLRLGGAVAALAAAEEAAVGALILWSPVIAGSRYLDELIRKKLYGEITAQDPPADAAEVHQRIARDGFIEILGDRLSQRMSTDLSELDLSARIGSFRGPVLVSSVANRRGRYPQFEALVQAYESAGADCTFEVAEQRAYWDGICMNEWYIPGDLYDRTLEWAQAQALDA